MSGSRLRPAGLAICLVIAWQLVATLNILNELYWTRSQALASAPIAWAFLSSPISVLSALPPAVLSGGLLTAGWATLWHASIATLIAFSMGAWSGKRLASSENLRAAVIPLQRAIAGIPPVTLLPIFLLAFRLSAWSVVALAVFGAFFSATAICTDAFMSVPSDLSLILRKIGYSRRGASLWAISVVSRHLLAGLRETARWALILVVVGEMHGSLAGGIGAYVDSARLNQLYANVYLGVIVCGFISYILSYSLAHLAETAHRAMQVFLMNRSQLLLSRVVRS